MAKKPDPNCEHCGGTGYTEWSSYRGTWPRQEFVAAGRDKCRCVKTDEENRKDDDYNRAHERVC